MMHGNVALDAGQRGDTANARPMAIIIADLRDIPFTFSQARRNYAPAAMPTHVGNFNDARPFFRTASYRRSGSK